MSAKPFVIIAYANGVAIANASCIGRDIGITTQRLAYSAREWDRIEIELTRIMPSEAERKAGAHG